MNRANLIFLHCDSPRRSLYTYIYHSVSLFTRGSCFAYFVRDKGKCNSQFSLHFGHVYCKKKVMISTCKVPRQVEIRCSFCMVFPPDSDSRNFPYSLVCSNPSKYQNRLIFVCICVRDLHIWLLHTLWSFSAKAPGQSVRCPIRSYLNTEAVYRLPIPFSRFRLRLEITRNTFIFLPIYYVCKKRLFPIRLPG